MAEAGTAGALSREGTASWLRGWAWLGPVPAVSLVQETQPCSAPFTGEAMCYKAGHVEMSPQCGWGKSSCLNRNWGGVS